jgi:hypothetical protein
MVKEPDSRGSLIISDDFMTNADLPSLVTADMPNPANPYSGKPINSEDKKRPLTVAQAGSFQPRRHGPYSFTLSGIREFFGDRIFSSASWGEWQAVE